MKSSLLVILFLLCTGCYTYSETINVMDFGAKGNGINDDTEAFLNSFKEAVKSNKTTIIVPYGKYKISKPLDIYYTDQSLIIKGLSKNGEKPAIFSDKNITMISLRGYAFRDHSKGSATIENLKIRGANIPYTKKHPFIHKGNFFYGIYIADKNTAIIKDVEVENIYGQGIGIISTDREMSGKGRFDLVSITNSKIINCWGYNPSNDDYGDGIFVANAASGRISNNEIRNDFNKTKHLGRGGIVVEFNNENIVIEKNKVYGYDRGIHLEGNCGGIQINNNTITGSDLGIVVYEVPSTTCLSQKPLVITNNFISNLGLPANDKLERVRMPRSLMNFYAKDNSMSGTTITNNQFIVDGSYAYSGQNIINIEASGISVTNNNFLVKNKRGAGSLKLIQSSGNSFSKNTFNEIQLIKQ